MIIDKQLLFSENVALTTAATTASTVVDTKVAGDSIANPLIALCRVATTFASTGAATLAVALKTSAAANKSNPVTLFTSPTYALSALVAGADLVKVHVPYEDALRYVWMEYTVGTEAMSAGAISSALVPAAEIGV